MTNTETDSNWSTSGPSCKINQLSIEKEMKMLLNNKVAIVTGGARGIGKGIALKFAEEGCAVVVADILESEAKQTLAELSKKGTDGIFVNCDHSDSRQVNDMVEKVIAKYGKIDILVNNAGKFGLPVPITDLSEEEWDKTIKINLKGVFLCCKAVAPYMIEKKSGKIINISSIGALTAGPPNPHYHAAKGGILSLTVDLALEFARFGINVNAILPGAIRTDLWKPYIPSGANDDQFFKDLAGTLVPLRRVGTPEDIGRAALFFASELSDYVTGDRLIVGGGLPLQAPAF
jgi:NAD(P)-dependent dehydrogenase (short-subunit alcohol dehydrogenase family)